LSVSFTYNRTAQGLTVSFEGSVSGGTAPYVFSWDFGDGQTSLGQRASHTYAAAGTYIVRLSVTDANAASGSASQSVGVGAANYTVTSGFTTRSSPAPPSSSTAARRAGHCRTRSSGTSAT